MPIVWHCHLAYNSRSMNASSNRKSITDSPWYWVYLFCTVGAVALVLAGPKFAARQSQIERNYEARQVAAKHAANESADHPGPALEQQTQTRVTLWPLFVTLGVVLSVAWFQLWRHHKRTSRHQETSSMGTEATA